MKAIETRFLGPTNTRGSRIVASDSDSNRIEIGYSHELNSEGCHRQAAEALCQKMGWAGSLVGGSTKRGMCWIFLD